METSGTTSWTYHWEERTLDGWSGCSIAGDRRPGRLPRRAVRQGRLGDRHSAARRRRGRAASRPWRHHCPAHDPGHARRGIRVLAAGSRRLGHRALVGRRSVSRRRSSVRTPRRWIGGAPLVVASELIVAGLGVAVPAVPLGSARALVVPPPAPRTRMVLVATHRRRRCPGSSRTAAASCSRRSTCRAAHADQDRRSGRRSWSRPPSRCPGTIVHALLGHIDWGVVAVFGVTSIPLSYLGGRVAVRTQSTRARAPVRRRVCC